MAKRILIVFVFLGMLCLSGCLYTNEPAAEIVSGQRRHVPRANLEHSNQPVVNESLNPEPLDLPGNVPRQWFPPKHLEKRWKAVVVHHSATENGNSAIFGKLHKQERHWKGIGYDFVIGNGTNSSNGQVEVTFRWKSQIAGAHCGGTKGNWANEEGIGICLVGDFNKTRPTSSQMQSLVKLVDFLQRRYNIPKSRIYGHGTTPGAQPTDCPGRMFPMARFKSMLDF